LTLFLFGARYSHFVNRLVVFLLTRDFIVCWEIVIAHQARENLAQSAAPFILLLLPMPNLNALQTCGDQRDAYLTLEVLKAYAAHPSQKRDL